jgi:nuclear pore complex protein Nup155
MGLFEDIERAWFTVDNKLFLWDYNDGSVPSWEVAGSYADDPDAISADMTSSPRPYDLLD